MLPTQAFIPRASYDLCLFPDSDAALVIYQFRDDARSLLSILNAFFPSPPSWTGLLLRFVRKKTSQKPSMRLLLCSVEGYFWSGARAWTDSALTVIALFVSAAFSGAVQQGLLGKRNKGRCRTLLLVCSLNNDNWCFSSGESHFSSCVITC